MQIVDRGDGVCLLDLMLAAYIAADFDNLSGFECRLVRLVWWLDDVTVAAWQALAVIAIERHTLEGWSLEGVALERGSL